MPLVSLQTAWITSVPGLATKDILDVQISVVELAPIRAALAPLGFDWRRDNSQLTKRYFREREGLPRTHIHPCSAERELESAIRASLP
jgi:GrpB-like predicted nucleotidyltransferase (UPF0157 family)